MENKLKLPVNTDIRSRGNHINNAFYQSAFPQIKPNQYEIDKLFDYLDLEPNECAYCGRKFNDLEGDHLHPLMSDEDEHTVYMTDITNIIPCCSECNRKKGKKSFTDFYTKDYIITKCGMSPEKYEDRFKKISEYEKLSKKIHLDDDDLLFKQQLLECKDKFIDILHKCAVGFGNDVLKKNGYLPQLAKTELSETDLENLSKLFEIFGVSDKKVSFKRKIDDEPIVPLF